MKIKITKKQEQYAMIIATSLITVNQFLSVDWFSIPQKFLGYTGVSILFILFCRTLLDNNIKAIFIKITLLSIILLSMILSGRQFLLVSFLFMMLISSDNLENILKTVLYTSFACIVVTIINYFIMNGFDFSNYELRTVLGGEVRVLKESLGYNHANKLFLNCFIPFSIYLYLNFDSITFKKHLVFFICFTILFLISFSRTGYISYIFAHLGYFVIKNKKSSNVMKLIILITIMSSFILPLLYSTVDSSLILNLNRALSDRIRYSSEGLKFAKLTPFGTNINNLISPQGYKITVDNSFVLTFISYGYVVFIGFVIFQGFIIFKSRNKVMIYFIMVFSVYYFAESYYFSAIYNFTLFLIAVETKEIYYERKNI
uniref:Polysaccharide polymerase n=1 Tax=Erysipelothrix sp. 715 TaxID=2711235 RepID=A0A6S6I7S7_9FIRM|nr:hypothetical protein [Erysipelothrix sp. 715]